MDIQALKIELIKEIVSSESKELLDKIYTALQGEKVDFWLELTEDEKEEVRISREQIKNGNTEDWTDIYDRLTRKSA